MANRALFGLASQWGALSAAANAGALRSVLAPAAVASLRWMAAAAAPPPPPAAPLDHELLRTATAGRSAWVRADPNLGHRVERHEFTPDPASQLCTTWSFYSAFFFKGSRLSASILQKAVQAGVAELPVLAGRIKVKDSSRFAGTVVDCNNEGALFSTAIAPHLTLADLGTHTWAQRAAGHRLGEFPVPFYVEPYDVAKAEKGKEPLLKVKLTRCADGNIVSVSISHVLADVGRLMRLMQRLADNYQALWAGRDPSASLRLSSQNSIFASHKHMAEALVQPPAGWQPEPIKEKLTWRQLMRLPYTLWETSQARYDMHQLFLPNTVVQRLKQVASAGGRQRVSTQDTLQAFMHLLKNDVRGKSLVPDAGAIITFNADATRRLASQVKEDVVPSLDSHFGNALQMLKVRGYASGQGLDESQFAPRSPQLYGAALAANAALVRSAVDGFGDAAGMMHALHEQEQLAQANKLKVLSIFVGKNEEKRASTSSLTTFPFDKIDFGFGAPCYFQCANHPWFDLWSLITPALAHGDGVLCSMILPAGLGERLQASPALKALAPEGQLMLGGRVYPRPDAAVQQPQAAVQQATLSAEEQRRLSYYQHAAAAQGARLVTQQGSAEVGVRP